MPRTPSVPKYRHFKPRNLAVVRVRTAAGEKRDIYLGVYNSPESLAEYARVLAELATNPFPHAPGGPGATVDELLLAFVLHAQTHYRGPDGKPTDELREIKRSVLHLRKLYGHTPAAAFGPKALAAVRQEMIVAGWCRSLINRRVERIKRAFKWGASQELVPVAVHQAMRTLAGLQKGRTDARESEPVEPVPVEHVAATMPFLMSPVRAMVELQLCTGMRPGEACSLRLEQVVTSGDVWLYRPKYHKGTHRGRDRVIPLGPKARAVIGAFLAGRQVDPAAPLFSPAQSRAEWALAQRAARKSKVPPSQVNRRTAKPKKVPGASYSVKSYGFAIRKAAQRAKVANWHPNQLRHTFATEVRKAHGLEAAQVMLGHSRADVTQVYAERDSALATRVAATFG